jgi:hypothetical protein
MATINSIGSNIPIQITKGGTQVASTTAYGVLCGGTTSTGALQNAGTGTSGQFLVSNGSSSLPTWGAGGGSSGALILLQTQTISSSTAEVDFTTGFSSSYSNYLITVNNFWPVTNGANLYLQVSSNGGSSYATSGYTSGTNTYGYNSTTLINTNITSGIVVFVSQAPFASSAGASAQMWFSNITSAIQPQPTMFVGQSSSFITSSGSVVCGGLITGSTPSANVVNAFRFVCSTGNISVGTFSLYALSQ